jgi:hypothetical protein
VKELRRILCEHIIENPQKYIGFFAVSDMSESYNEGRHRLSFKAVYKQQIAKSFRMMLIYNLIEQRFQSA